MKQWEMVDEGWGRRAAEVATLHEPQNAREYVFVHERTGVRAGSRVLDIACGAGLAAELAAARGATVAGIDASPRLVAVARDRLPGADLRVGDMRALPWPDGSFDVVTSFRGIWGTTPEVLAEVLRVLRPGGRLGLTVWGHIKASSGAWALQPFTWATTESVAHQAAMNSLGKPGIGEQVLAQAGLDGVERVRVPFVWEFADPASYARALASTGPAFEAIQAIGEAGFVERATELAAQRVRDGLPLRAEIEVVCFLARKPVGATAVSFLDEPALLDEAAQRLYADDLEEPGFVMNASRLWAHGATAAKELFDLLGHVTATAGLSFRDRGILVLATASTIGDAYCSLTWGRKLAGCSSPEVAAGVITGDDTLLDDRERALAAWARRVADDPNATTAADVAPLRAAGFDDAQILAITTYVALRIAFATVNDALGATPDAQLRAIVPATVQAAVRYGRPVAD